MERRKSRVHQTCEESKGRKTQIKFGVRRRFPFDEGGDNQSGVRQICAGSRDSQLFSRPTARNSMPFLEWRDLRKKREWQGSRALVFRFDFADRAAGLSV